MVDFQDPNDPIAKVMQESADVAQKAQSLQSSMLVGIGANPTVAAGNNRVARALGTTPDVVGVDSARYEQMAKMQGFDFAAHTQTYPVTTGIMSDVSNASAALAELDKYHQLEDAFSGKVQSGALKGLTAAQVEAVKNDYMNVHHYNDSLLGMLGTHNSVDQAVASTVSSMTNAFFSPYTNLLGMAAGAFNPQLEENVHRNATRIGLGGSIKRGYADTLTDPKTGQQFANPLAGATIQGGADTVGGMIGTIAMMILGGEVAAPVLSMNAGWDQFKQATSKGASPWAAISAGMTAGAANLALLKFMPHPVSNEAFFGTKAFGAARSFEQGAVGAYDKSVVGDGFKMLGDTSPGITGTTAKLGYQSLVDDVAGTTGKELLGTAIKSTARAVPLAGGMTFIDNAVRQLYEPDGDFTKGFAKQLVTFALYENMPVVQGIIGNAIDAHYRYQRLQDIHDAIQKTKLATTDPVGFQEHLEQLSQGAEVSMPEQAFTRFYQAKGQDPAKVAEEMGITNYSEAVQLRGGSGSGTELQIPVSGFLKLTKGKAEFNELAPDLRLMPGTPTANEAAAHAKAFADNVQQHIDAIHKMMSTDIEHPEREAIINQSTALFKQLGGPTADAAPEAGRLFTNYVLSVAKLNNSDPLKLASTLGAKLKSGESFLSFGEKNGQASDRSSGDQGSTPAGGLQPSGRGEAGGGSGARGDAAPSRNHIGSQPLGLAPLPGSDTLHHGSKSADLAPNTLSVDHAEEGSRLAQGVYLTPDSGDARGYAERNGTGSLQEVQHNIQAPVDLSPSATYTREQAAAVGVELPEGMDEVSGSGLWNYLVQQKGGMEQAKQAMLDAGYDSGHYLDQNGKTIYAVWDQAAVGRNRAIERNGQPVDEAWVEKLANHADTETGEINGHPLQDAREAQRGKFAQSEPGKLSPAEQVFAALLQSGCIGRVSEGLSWSFGRRLQEGSGGTRVLGIPVHETWSLNPDKVAELAKSDFVSPDVHELDYNHPDAAQVFHDAIAALKEGNRFAASVHVYDVGEYAQMRMFLSEDGKAGFALKPDGDIVSVFSNGKEQKGAAHTMLEVAKQAGGNKLDCFDTKLPFLYSQHGFTTASRIPWNDAHAPEGWDPTVFAQYKEGRPDVVFMAYSPLAEAYQLTDGELTTDYQHALDLQTMAQEAAQEPMMHLMQALATRVPSGKGADTDPTNVRTTGLAPMLEEPDKLEKNLNAVERYPGVKPTTGDPAARAEAFIEHVKNNLLWLHDQMPEDIRNRAKLWYDGAQKIASEWAEKNSKTLSQISGIIAAMSPQKDWFQNVSLAERVINIMRDQSGTKWTPEMETTAAKIWFEDSNGKARPDKTIAKNQVMLDQIKGKTLSEIKDSTLQAMWLRTYDEAHNSKDYRIIAPDGTPGEIARNQPTKKQAKAGEPGSPSKAAWGSLAEISKAIDAYNDASPENISDALGDAHKVRNFYNNIFDPSSPDFTTIDTHAVAAGLLLPVGGSYKEVAHNFAGKEAPKSFQHVPGEEGVTSNSAQTGAGGTYGLYHEAYNRAAQERGILPREMQSITWEAVRGLFGADWKSETNYKKVAEIWQQYKDGNLDINSTRQQISDLAGGMKAPDWHVDMDAPDGGVTMHVAQPGDGNERGSLDIYASGKKVINVTADQNTSTVFHELFHFFVQSIHEMAQETDATSDLKDLNHDIHTWLGVPDDQPIPEDKHELFADTGLQWLAEGKAPSSALQSTFDKVSSWFTKIGRQLLGVDISSSMHTDENGAHVLKPEVRAIFERLVASDDAANQALKELGNNKIFATAEDMGVTEKEFKVYQDMLGAQLAKTHAAILEKLTKEAEQRQTAAYREQRDSVAASIKDQLSQLPEYQALKALVDGKILDKDGNETPLKLSKSLVDSQYGAGTADDLARGFQHTWTVDGGMDADAAAEILKLHGVDVENGQDLIDKLSGLERLNDRVKRETEATMQQEHPDLMKDKEALREEAMKALHNEKREEVLAVELRALNRLKNKAQPLAKSVDEAAELKAKLADVKQQLAEAKGDTKFLESQANSLMTKIADLKAKQEKADSEAAASRQSRAEAADALPSMKAARAAAAAFIGTTPVFRTNPNAYLQAEQKANREAFKLQGRGDYAGAADAKRTEILNHFMYLEAMKARDFADQAMKFAKNLSSGRMQSRLGKADNASDGTFQEQVNTILNRFEFTKRTNADLTRREALAQWVERMTGSDEETAIADWLLNEITTKNYRQLTNNELRDVHDALTNIKHLADRQLSVTIKGEKIEFNDLTDRIAESTLANNEVNPRLMSGSTQTWFQKKLAWLAGKDASMMKIEWIINKMDGNSVDGPMNRSVLQPLRDAQGERYRLTEEVTERLRKLVDALPDENKNSMADNFTVKGLSQPLNRSQILAMLALYGTESSRRKLIGGYATKGMTVDTAMAAFAHLNQSDVDLVKGVWDSMEQLWPESAALQKRMSGVEPVKEEHSPFSIKLSDGSTAELPGGYFPLKAARGESSVADMQSTKMGSDLFDFKGNYTKASTATGHLKTRTGAIYPLDLNFANIISSHVNQVVTDLSHREAVTLAARVLSSQKVKTALRDTLGPEATDQMMPWLKYIVNSSNPGANDAGSGWLDWSRSSRSNMVASTIGFSMSPFLKHLTDLSVIVGPGEYRVPALKFAQAFCEFVAHPQKTFESVSEMSDMMKYRFDHIDRDFQKAQKELDFNSGRVTRWMDGAEEVGHTALGIQDKIFSIATFMGAYRHALEQAGPDADPQAAHETAVRVGERAVGMLRMSGAPMDLIGMQRSPDGLNRLITCFMGNGPAHYNLMRGLAHDVDGLKGIATFTAAGLTMSMAAMTASMITGHGPKDKATDKEKAEWAIVHSMLAWAEPIPVVRDVASALADKALGTGTGEYRLTPVVGYIEKVLLGLPSHTMQLAKGKEDAATYAVNVVDILGTMFGVPGTAQLTKSVKYQIRKSQGKEHPENAAQEVFDTVTGNHREAKK